MGDGRATPSAYVFDFDGTLGSIPVDWVSVRAGLKEITGSKEELKSVFPTINHILERRPEDRDRIFELIDRYEAAAAPSAILYPGALELLSTLSGRSRLALVTMQGAAAASSVLGRLGLKPFFVRWLTRNDSLDRGEQVELALEAMDAKKESSIFVGDRLNDLNAAKRIGVPFTLIRTHGEDPEDARIEIYHSIGEYLGAVRARLGAR